MNPNDEWDDWGDELNTAAEPAEKSMTSNSINDERKIDIILESLREFQKDLADTEVFEVVNRQLTRTKYDQFMAYYSSNAKLSQYTIDTELKVFSIALYFVASFLIISILNTSRE